MLYEDEEKKPVDPNVARMRRGTGTFAVVRIRNKTDLDALADLLDEPRLKGMKRDTTMNLKWHAAKHERDAMSQFFGDDNE